MIRKTVYAVVLVVLGVAVAAVGDVVILQNGDRVEGEIVSDTPAEVLIKRTYKSGIKFTEKIERSKIARIEKGEAEAPAPAPVSATAHSLPAASQPVALSDAEKKQLLDTALVHWKKEKPDYVGAGMALSRLINGSSKVELNRMSKEVVEKDIELSLGDMAAEAHLQAAIARSKGQGVVLPYVTDYEKPYLVPRLIEAYEEAIKKPVGVEPVAPKPVAKPKTKAAVRPKAGEPPPTPEPVPDSQPAGKRFVLSELLKDPAPFTGTHEEAMAVARQIRFASSLLTARTRYDGEYKTKPEVKKEVEENKKKLATLQKELFAKPGEATPGKETKARPAMGGHQAPKPGGAEREGVEPAEHGPAGNRILKGIQRQQKMGEEGEGVNPNEKENDNEK